MRFTNDPNDETSFKEEGSIQEQESLYQQAEFEPKQKLLT